MGQLTVDFDSIRGEISKAVVGQREVVNQMLVALLCEGHALLEGVPGIAKTLMVRALSLTVSASFSRIQFTPDLMPSDVLGINVFDPSSGKFDLRKGPVFTGLLLADEINRTPPKTQSALLEAMQERQVTIDGQKCPLPAVFTVFATQNPIEYEGTYPLPEAQLDRFMLKIIVGYPAFDTEREVLSRYNGGFRSVDIDQIGIRPVLDAENAAPASQGCRRCDGGGADARLHRQDRAQDTREPQSCARRKPACLDQPAAGVEGHRADARAGFRDPG